MAYAVAVSPGVGAGSAAWTAAVRAVWAGPGRRGQGAAPDRGQVL
ncbi:hypothetical protein SSCG_03253 [Streptomyces clavuligerus]|nr:hypothetical protein SSCG_03253 [Streptomyces clavuligerus]